MNNYKIKYCSKGSRKNGADFENEIVELSKITNRIEIDFNYPHDRDFDDEVRFLVEAKKRNNLIYTVHAQYLSGNLADINQSIREETINTVRYAIDKAQELEAEVVTIHPALEPYGLSIPESVEFEIDSYKRIAEYAGENSIKIGLENEAQTCFFFPERACKIDKLIETIERVAMENFGMTLDIGHANVSGENYIEVFNKHKNTIFHIHAHDNIGNVALNQKSFGRPDPHLAIGEGNINWKGIVKTLAEINYQGFFEVECEVGKVKQSVDYLDTLK